VFFAGEGEADEGYEEEDCMVGAGHAICLTSGGTINCRRWLQRGAAVLLIGGEELLAEPGFDLFGSEGVVDGCEVGREEVGCCPVKLLFEQGIFPVQGGIRDGAAVGADAKGDFEFAEAVDGVVGQVGVHIGLEVAAGADFEQDVGFFQVAGQRRVFDASDAMADAGRVEVIQ